ncbi:ParB/RepB/Spo0J family partition protein, partial [Candidatus Parcubacteria bacterium]|nr:ParB/RepB/Spo0J family partition protein [Candidatus Parcubacteria bacterium]
PRKFFCDIEMEGLMDSIKTHGILQPLIVSPKEGGKYEIVAGERRYRAAKLGGLKHVPVIVRDVKDHEKMELALVENIQRQDLNAIEEAEAYKQLMDEFGFTQEDVARKMGKSRPVIANMLRLLNLSEEIKKAIAKGKLSASAGRVLAGIADPIKQDELYHKMLQGLSVRESEIKSRLGKEGVHSKRTTKDQTLIDLEEKLREVLKTKVDIKKMGKTCRLMIECYSDDELNKIAKLLNG